MLLEVMDILNQQDKVVQSMNQVLSCNRPLHQAPPHPHHHANHLLQ
jgi:hypothetical protein